jgi:BON domain-containing protein
MNAKFLAAPVLVLFLAACGEDLKPAAPPPPPASKAPAPQNALSQPPPAVEAKAPEAPRPDPNKELAQRVKRALEGEPKIQGAAIDVTAADGVVTLWGTQATGAARSLAVETAAKVTGVKAVNSRLVIVAGS